MPSGSAASAGPVRSPRDHHPNARPDPDRVRARLTAILNLPGNSTSGNSTNGSSSARPVRSLHCVAWAGGLRTEADPDPDPFPTGSPREAGTAPDSNLARSNTSTRHTLKHNLLFTDFAPRGSSMGIEVGGCPSY
jgi:hypothetical protein